MGSAAAEWDRAAGTFDREADHGLRDPTVRVGWRTLLRAHLPAPPARIADVGCGTGSLAVLLAEDGHRVTGCDFSRPMLAQARSKAAASGVGVGLLMSDVARPPLRTESFDAVLCRHVLWALEDLDGALEHWMRLLRRDGRLVLIEGRWATGSGLPATAITEALGRLGRATVVHRLSDDQQLWGRAVHDERYLIVS